MKLNYARSQTVNCTQHTTDTHNGVQHSIPAEVVCVCVCASEYMSDGGVRKE